MSRHTGQNSSKPDPHSDASQLVVLTQHNKRLMHDFLSFKITQYQHQDELNLLLNTARLPKYHYFAVEQQHLLSLPDKASQDSRSDFLSYLTKIYGAQIAKGSILSICDPLTNTYISLIYETLSNPVSDTLLELPNGI